MGIAALRNQLHSWKTVALDTNIFVYQLLDHPKYAPLTDLILHAVEKGRPQAVTTTITLAEILAKAEQQAAEIFSRAGINVLWIACPVSPT